MPRQPDMIIYASDGHDEDADSDGLRRLRRRYPDAVAYDAGGFRTDLTLAGLRRADERDGRVALVWANAEAAGEPGSGDTGAHAVAEIRRLGGQIEDAA